MGDNSDNDIVSVEAGFTSTGLKAKIRSKAVSAVDWLLGGRVKAQGLDTDAVNRLAETINNKAVQTLEDDPELIQAAEANIRAKFIRRFKNKEAVTAEAKKVREEKTDGIKTEAEDLAVSEEFIEEFEPYAEKASTERLRQMWGKVLAAEVSVPGTISHRVMRIINEIEPETARLFEKLCKHRIGDAIPVCFADKMTLPQQKKLENAELFVPVLEEGLAKPFCRTTREFIKAKKIVVWAVELGEYTICFLANKGVEKEIQESANFNLKALERHLPIIWHLTRPVMASCPAIPVYILTKSGQALASVFGYKQEAALGAYLKTLSGGVLPETEIAEYKNTGKRSRLVRIWKNGEPQSASAA